MTRDYPNNTRGDIDYWHLNCRQGDYHRGRVFDHQWRHADPTDDHATLYLILGWAAFTAVLTILAAGYYLLRLPPW